MERVDEAMGRTGPRKRGKVKGGRHSRPTTHNEGGREEGREEGREGGRDPRALEMDTHPSVSACRWWRRRVGCPRIERYLPPPRRR